LIALGDAVSDSEKLMNRPFARVAESLRRAVDEQREREQREREQREREQRERAAAAAVSAAARAQPLTDEALFRREMKGVQPLSGDIHVLPRAAPAMPAPRDEEAEVMAQLADLVSGRAGFDFCDSDEYIEGIGQGLDRRLLKKLRQGFFAVQAHLDLHGKTRAEARLLVEQFIVDSRVRGRRCVLIVHGRGLNSKDQVPVLKESLKVWLARGRIARSVLGFCSARPSDGGVGAVYVLLRK
jgi:DNA-nicking Smr family endonuclease